MLDRGNQEARERELDKAGTRGPPTKPLLQCHGLEQSFLETAQIQSVHLHANLKLEAELLLLTTLKWHCSNLCSPGTSDNSNVES